MNIAIAGYGVEGRSSYDYFVHAGHNVTIVDERIAIDDLPPDARSVLGENAFSSLADMDMVIRTPSLRPDRIRTNGKIWSATNEFFSECPAPIIGVTGTKGKGTVCSLITSILSVAGKTVHLVGNIGTPALEVLPDIKPDDIVVYELSSFQLWDLERSPHIAVILMIEPDHLDVHSSMDEYVNAKAKIIANQAAGDICFYCPDNKFVQIILERNRQSAAVPYNRSSGDSNHDIAFISDDNFVVQRRSGDSTIPLSVLKIKGRHNQENATAAICAALQFGADDSAVTEGLAKFGGLPHRLKFVQNKKGVDYFDDSIATTPGSTIAAIRAFKQPVILIAGGSSKGADFSELAVEIKNSTVKKCLLIGDEADKIAENLHAKGFEDFEIIEGDMSEIVARAASYSNEGDVVLLSPACASFGMFKNYSDRGDQFVEAIGRLA